VAHCVYAAAHTKRHEETRGCVPARHDPRRLSGRAGAGARRRTVAQQQQRVEAELARRAAARLARAVRALAALAAADGAAADALAAAARALPRARLELLQAACDGHSEFLLSDFVRLAASGGASCTAAHEPQAPCRIAAEPRAGAGGRGGAEPWACFAGGCAEVGLWAARGALAWRASPRDHCAGRSWRRRGAPRSARRGRGASVPRGARAAAELQVRPVRTMCKQ